MVSEADILEALRNSPTLKVLLDLPARVAELERRLKLVTAPKAAVAREGSCPYCSGALRITNESNHPIFGMMGMKIRTLACDSCGRETTRDYDPDKG